MSGTTDSLLRTKFVIGLGLAVERTKVGKLEERSYIAMCSRLILLVCLCNQTIKNFLLIMNLWFSNEPKLMWNVVQKATYTALIQWCPMWKCGYLGNSIRHPCSNRCQSYKTQSTVNYRKKSISVISLTVLG